MSSKDEFSWLSPHSFSQKDVEELDHTLDFQGYGSLRSYSLRHRKFDGGWSQTMKREVYDTGDAVVVLPYNPVTDEVVLIEQFRITAYHSNRNPWMVECIAGRIENNESEETTACREAHEEAGVEIKTLYRINSMFMSPGVYTEYATMFCGLIDAVSVEKIHGLDHEHEDIGVITAKFEDAIRALDRGLIQSSPPHICLQWLARFRDRLRAGLSPFDNCVS